MASLPLLVVLSVTTSDVPKPMRCYSTPRVTFLCSASSAPTSSSRLSRWTAASLASAIITGGANVVAAEVELILTQHPGVRDAAVIGLKDDDLGRRVHALIEPASADAPPALEELGAWPMKGSTQPRWRRCQGLLHAWRLARGRSHDGRRSDHFRLIFGTSTASIIAALLALCSKANDVYGLYRDHVPKITKPKARGQKSQALAALAHDVFKEQKFRSGRAPLGRLVK